MVSGTDCPHPMALTTSGPSDALFALVIENRAVSRSDMHEIAWNEAPAEMEFLVRDGGFAEPIRTKAGIIYHRAGLSIEMWCVSGREPELVVTFLHPSQPRGVHLGCIFLACGCGVAQDLPSNITNHRTTRLRITQHANALRCVLSHLTEEKIPDLFARCLGRPYPDDAPPPRCPELAAIGHEGQPVSGF